MGSHNFKKKKKAWKQIYNRKLRRILKMNRDKISKGCFRHTLTGHRWYDIYD